MMLPPIYTILAGDAAVAAIVGDRIYPHGDAPQGGGTQPYVTWFVVSSAPENGVSDAPTVDRVAVQIDCWHPTSAGVVALASAVRLAVEQHAHVTTISLDTRDADTRLYRFAVELDYWLGRA
jgi:hypothetical protein